MATGWAFVSRAPTVAHRESQCSRSGSGSLASASGSRTQARSGSVLPRANFERTSRGTAPVVCPCGSLHRARSALSQSRACERSSARAAASGGGSSFPWPQPARAAARAAWKRLPMLGASASPGRAANASSHRRAEVGLRVALDQKTGIGTKSPGKPAVPDALYC
jgi:hypothetical protein